MLAEILDHLDRAWEQQRVARITPTTAMVLASCVRFYRKRSPTHEEIVRAICHVKGGCASHCYNCVGHANVVMRVYEDREWKD